MSQIRPPLPQPVRFPSADGPTLEGVLTLPKGTGPFAGVVICHPHPQQGGTMRNNVVEGVCRALEAAGIASLRFNFRGVGASRGEYTGGAGEQEDARAALAFLSSYPGIDAARVGLAGYSFGSRITMEIASQEPGLPAVAFIGPTNNTISDATALAGFSGPKLFISGGRDHVVEQDALARFVHGLPSPKELRVIPDIDHFWVGAETLAGETVAQFFIQALGVGPPAPPAS